MIVTNNKIVAIIQARTGSTRLPRKVLMSIGEKTMLEWVIERTKKASLIHNIVVATSTKEEDDIIEKLCKKLNVKCFRGSEEDVLSRYYETSKQMKADIIVRITADCPFIDPQIIDEIIKIHLENKNDYTQNDTEDSYPKGTDVEVFNFECLEEAHLNADKPYQREHVTPYIWKDSKKFKVETLFKPFNYSHIRLCVDELDDLTFLRELYKKLDRVEFNLPDIINVLNSHPNLPKTNQHVKQKTI